jgi:succinylglutamic semialdehyde dehydrogenase
MNRPDHFVRGSWLTGEGRELRAHDPSTGHLTFHGTAATDREISAAVDAAAEALENWSELPLDARIRYLEAFAAQIKAVEQELIDAICVESGKPRWEARTEFAAVVNKIPLSIKAAEERRSPSFSPSGSIRTGTWYKPHGVCAVFGPFNFPAHLPNGHIVPALLAGNTVVFKPSELTPSAATVVARCWESAGLPPGVFNLVQGDGITGAALAAHGGVNGIFFTGSVATGVALARLCAEDPAKILALEMGGNNPVVVSSPVDIEAAAYWTIYSAFISAGQRCSCARRLIFVEGPQTEPLLDRIVELAGTLRIGSFRDDPEPFMGPVVTPRAATRVLQAADSMLQHGGRPLLAPSRLSRSEAFLSPCVIDVTEVEGLADEEIFGPVVTVFRAKSLPEAVQLANRTRFGLAASLFCDDPGSWDYFRRKIRAGVVNWNQPTVGASGALPFGGIGLSGNHRPSGSWACDYCSYPIATMEQPRLLPPSARVPGLG